MKQNTVTLPACVIELSEQEQRLYASLRRVFVDVVLFGGCLREQFIRQNTPYSAPTHDLDFRVAGSQLPMPQRIADYLSELPQHTCQHLPDAVNDDVEDWIGMRADSIRNTDDVWLFTFAASQPDNPIPVDISILKEPYNKYDSCTDSVLMCASAAFSAVCYSDKGFTALPDFVADTTAMRFNIRRTLDPRKTLWDIPYYGILN